MGRLLFVGVLVLLIVFSGYVSALSCALPSAESLFIQNDAIFSGGVLEIEDKSDYKILTFSADRFWKGHEWWNEDRSLVVKTSEETLWGAYLFEEGEEYLVYSVLSDGELTVDITCPSVKRLSDAAEDIKMLGKFDSSTACEVNSDCKLVLEGCPLCGDCKEHKLSDPEIIAVNKVSYSCPPDPGDLYCPACATPAWDFDAEDNAICVNNECTKKTNEGDECNTKKDCPQIYCVTTPCPGYVCVEGECVIESDNCASEGELCAGIAGVECCSPLVCVGRQDDFPDTTGTCVSNNPGCTLETKECSDGSIVSRVPPGCGFEKCPGEEDFCGASTLGECGSDSDCVTGGCSGQVCQGASEEGIITTCEFRECYGAEKYGLGCGCIDNKCQWADGKCPKDLKVCPDGSKVIRSWPSCEFSECPTQEEGTGIIRKFLNWLKGLFG